MQNFYRILFLCQTPPSMQPTLHAMSAVLCFFFWEHGFKGLSGWRLQFALKSLLVGLRHATTRKEGTHSCPRSKGQRPPSPEWSEDTLWQVALVC